jgi:DNA-binding transcriptional MerR regulator
MSAQSNTYTIQQVAEMTGLSVHTLRYYERVRLLNPVPRASSGHRRYTQQDIDGVMFFYHLRRTGMSIQQMQQFAELYRQGDASLPIRRALLEEHQRGVEEHIASLQQNLKQIQKKIGLYRTQEQELLAAEMMEDGVQASEAEVMIER